MKIANVSLGIHSKVFSGAVAFAAVTSIVVPVGLGVGSFDTPFFYDIFFLGNHERFPINLKTSN
jgi:hypothetical protein